MNLVEIIPTYRCNLACKWCTQLCGSRFRYPDDMTLKRFEKYVDELVPHITSRSNIRIGGGEPTLYPQIFEALEIVMKKIRPLLEIPIVFLTNGVGENKVLQKIKEKYDTYDNSFIPLHSLLTKPSTKQLCINPSKARNTDAYIKMKHVSIYRAPIDLLPLHNNDWSKECPCKKYIFITPNGVFVCPIGPMMATIFKFGNGENHLLSLDEERSQKEKFCKYCPFIANTLSPGLPEITRSYKRAIESWTESPYFPEVVI